MDTLCVYGPFVSDWAAVTGSSPQDMPAEAVVSPQREASRGVTRPWVVLM